MAAPVSLSVVPLDKLSGWARRETSLAERGRWGPTDFGNARGQVCDEEVVCSRGLGQEEGQVEEPKAPDGVLWDVGP